jgi:hypothetical protein
MLRSANDLWGFSLGATDGEIGQIEEFLFDEHWIVHRIVVNIGGWFNPNKITLSTASINRVDWTTRSVETPLTRQEVKSSPQIVSRRSGDSTENVRSARANVSNDEDSANRTCSTKALKGFAIAARDGDIGHVDDFIIDDERWMISYAVFDTRNWLPGKKVIVPPGRIKKVDWRTGKIHAELSRRDIKNSPEYDETLTIDHEYEERIHRHYDEDCETPPPDVGAPHEDKPKPGVFPGEHD